MRILAALMLALSLAVSAEAAAPEPPKAASAPSSAVVDINRASVDQLKALKGVGEVRAAAIVKGRPYARKDDLVRRGVLPQSVYDGIREQIIAKQ